MTDVKLCQQQLTQQQSAYADLKNNIQSASVTYQNAVTKFQSDIDAIKKVIQASNDQLQAKSAQYNDFQIKKIAMATQLQILQDQVTQKQKAVTDMSTQLNTYQQEIHDCVAAQGLKSRNQEMGAAASVAVVGLLAGYLIA